MDDIIIPPGEQRWVILTASGGKLNSTERLRRLIKGPVTRAELDIMAAEVDPAAKGHSWEVEGEEE